MGIHAKQSRLTITSLVRTGHIIHIVDPPPHQCRLSIFLHTNVSMLSLALYSLEFVMLSLPLSTSFSNALPLSLSLHQCL